MNRIRLLSEQVANQIAAGEVIERPASVVKELVENALDAQPTRIGIEVQGGGRSLIRVTDDGAGMSRDDALMCLERHATSKIRRAEDLAEVITMGFRGEALPSIASVSRFTLTTRERDPASVEATQVEVAGGKMVNVRAAGAPPGTSVEVRQLFYNLPARRKFLRSEETERAHVQHYLLLAALAFPEVGFTFSHNGRLIWQLPPLPRGQDQPSRLAALRERLRALYGSELNLLPVEFRAALPVMTGPAEEEDRLQEEARAEGTRGDQDASEPRPRPTDFHLWGFLGAPGVSRSTREDQHLFVNRRPVENRGLNFALLEGYHTALMKGRYPVCCLFLDLDPAGVDVNIHPAKREVKFHAERQVRALVTQAVRGALLAYHARAGEGEESDLAPSRAGSPAAHSPGPTAASVPVAPRMDAVPPSKPLRLPSPAPPPAPRGSPPQSDPVATDTKGADRTEPPAGGGGLTWLAGGSPEVTEVLKNVPAGSSPVLAAGPSPLLSVPLRLVGVIGRLYVVLESDRGLVLLDQHAAHERILFEQMLTQLERGDAPSQRLLLAETVEVSVRDAAFVREVLPTLSRLGVGLSEFGERTFLLEALPPFVRAGDARGFVVELVDQLKAAGTEVNALRLGEHVVAKTVCRHAVKARDPLQGQELERLIEDLRGCAMPYTCPHGRPTLIELSYRELERKFGRTT